MNLRATTTAAVAFMLAALLSGWAASRAQVNPPAPPATNPPVPAPSVSASPNASPAATPLPGVPTVPGPTAVPTPTPTQPPIVVTPASGSVAVGSAQTLHVMSVLAPISVTVLNPAVVEANVDQAAETVTLVGKTPGATAVVVRDARGLTAAIPVRVAYTAGVFSDFASITITGDPASAEFIKAQAVLAARELVKARPGADIIATAGEVDWHRTLGPDDEAQVDVPILLQGEQYFSVSGTTHVHVTNLAAPKIVPDSLMVSDYPERLTENGMLFTADLKREQPSRFLYFHYNPPGEPDRRIVLRAQNRSPEPAIVQFITGAGGPGTNEMAVGHDATIRFLRRLVQNEGQVLVIPGNGALNLVAQLLPAKNIVCNLLQLRVLNGSTVHLALFAQNATASPSESLANEELLSGGHPHARGIYNIPEFHYSTLWNVTDPYLELPIGQIPLPNVLRGQALSGDYGVLQSFVVKVANPTSSPQTIAIYENPRGGRATGSYLIDGVLVQSHQTPPFSRYKVRQYVVPALGFVRVSIETIPDSGSSYPLRLVFAPDDGSVAPGAPGSPVY